MKTKIVKIEKCKKEFKPFTIEITCESIQEARLMYHLADCGNYNNVDSVNTKFCEAQHRPEFRNELPVILFNQIGEEIKKQGFEV